MPKGIVVRETGGPEVLKLEDIPEPKDPGPGQVLVRHTAIGINFTDTYYRSGLYKPPSMPFVPGVEACGVVEKTGPGVELEPGQRVAYATSRSGGYCEKRIIHVRNLVVVPDNVSDDNVAAGLLKGLSAHYLLFRTYRVSKGDAILVHAAAGGTGQFICQWASKLGAVVIGTVGDESKVAIAKRNGCNHVINYSEEDFAHKVKEYTHGEGVAVVYDSVGKATFVKSMQSLRPLGLLVSMGQSSGAVPPVNLLALASKGLFITRPTVMLYKSARMELVLSAREVFLQMEKGVLVPQINHRYALEEAAKAHEEIQARKTTGQCIIQV